jgi:hypothetical protein
MEAVSREAALFVSVICCVMQYTERTRGTSSVFSAGKRKSPVPEIYRYTRRLPGI